MTQQQRLDLAFRRVIQLLKIRTGDLTLLTTTNKSDLVSAINEVKNATASTASINDTTPSTTSTYSSSKTNTLLATKVGTTDNFPATQITGVLSPSQIPVIDFFKPLISTAATITALSAGEQANISNDGRGGTFNAVTLTDGSTWIYVSGSKILQASYILLSDTTPDFSLLSNKPTTVSGYGITDAVVTGGSYANPSWLTSLAAAKVTGLAAVATSGLKADVGLANVDNTSDVNKPISTAVQTALNTKYSTTEIGNPDTDYVSIINAEYAL